MAFRTPEDELLGLDDSSGLGLGLDYSAAPAPEIEDRPDLGGVVVSPRLAEMARQSAGIQIEEPAAEASGPVRSAWNAVVSPVKALVGASGSSGLHALGLHRIFPNAYAEAAAEREKEVRAAGGGPSDRPLSLLEQGEALPGLGDLAVQRWDADTVSGRILKPVARLVGNIAGDPMTYAGGAGVVGKLSKVGKATEGLRAASAAAEAGDVAAHMVPFAARALETARLTESPAARIGRFALTAATTPYTPLGGLAYAPEMVEGVVGGVNQSIDEAKAGEYGNAAASGVGAAITAALGGLVARGLVHESKAARALETVLAEQVGDHISPSDAADLQRARRQMDEAVATVRQPMAEERVVPPPAGSAQPVSAPPEPPPLAAEPPPPGEVAPPPIERPAELPVETPPTAAPPAPTPPALSPIEALVREHAASGDASRFITKAQLRQLLPAPISDQRLDKLSMNDMLRRVGGEHLAGELELVKGRGFRSTMKIEQGAAEPAPAAPMAEPPTVAEPAAIAPAESPAAPSAPSAPPIPSMTRAEIDSHLSQPAMRELVDKQLDRIRESQGLEHAHQLESAHVTAAVPGEENVAVRSLLHRALHAKKLTARMAEEEAGATAGVPPLPGEGAGGVQAAAAEGAPTPAPAAEPPLAPSPSATAEPPPSPSRAAELQTAIAAETATRPFTPPSPEAAARIAEERATAEHRRPAAPPQLPEDVAARFGERIAAPLRSVQATAIEELGGRRPSRDAVQNALVKWSEMLAEPPARTAAETDARFAFRTRLRELIVAEPDAARAQTELTKMLQHQVGLGHRTERRAVLTHAEKDTAYAAIRTSAAEGLSPEDAARSHYVEPREPAIDPNSPYAQQRQTLAAARTAYYRDKSTGVARTGKKGVPAPYMEPIKRLAGELGVKFDPRRGADRLLNSVARRLNELEARGTGKKPATALTPEGRLLIEQHVASREPQWDAAISRGARIGDSEMRVVDLERDAAALLSPTARIAQPIAEALSHVTNDIAETVGMPGRFSGLAPSPTLHGIRMSDGAIYSNLHQAYEQAVLDLGHRTFPTPAARAAATAEETATSLVDNILHEITHASADHDARGGADFTRALAEAYTRSGPLYFDAIRRVIPAVERSIPDLEQMRPTYRSIRADVLRRAENERLQARSTAVPTTAGREPEAGPVPAAERGGVAAAGDQPIRGAAAGAGARGTPPGARRPAGGEGGAVGGDGVGLRPSAALPGGEGQPPARPGAGAATVGRPAGVGGEEARRAGGPELGGAAAARPHASLVSDIQTAIADHRTNRTLQDIERAFTMERARLENRPYDDVAAEVNQQMRRVESLPAEERASLRNAGPGERVNIGLRLRNYPIEAMSDAQREHIGMILHLQNSQQPRATPMSFAQMDADARQLFNAHTPEELIRLQQRSGLKTPADFTAARMVISTLGQDFDLARAELRAAESRGDTDAIRAATDKIGLGFAKKMVAIHTLIPETTNVARVLAGLRLMIHPLTAEENFKSRFMGAMRAARIDEGKSGELYSMLTDTLKDGAGGNWDQFVSAFRSATKVGKFDKFLEFWKAGLLGWPTQIANTASNVLFAGLRNAEHGVQALVDPYLSGLTGKQQSRYTSEIGARMVGLKHALREAWPVIKEDLRLIAKLDAPDVGRRLREGTFYDEPDIRQLYGAIGGKTGEFVRIPFKLLDASDNFFKHIARSQEYAAQAERIARKEGRSFGEVFGEIRRVAADPFQNSGLYKRYKNVLAAGREAARADTFQGPLGPVTSKAQKFTQAHPALQLIFPFFKTPYNILKEGVARTPVGAANAIYKYGRGEIDNPELVARTIKSSIGSLMMMATASAALDGTITGGGPADPKEKEILKRTGWQPYSFHVGDQYVSYQRLEPFVTLLGISSDMAEAWKRKDIDNAGELMQKGITSMSDNLTNRSFVAGFDSLMKILTDPRREGATAVRQLEASLVPNIVGVVPVGHAARAIDPTYRQTEAFTTSPIAAQIPFLSETLPEQRGPSGEVRTRGETFGERLLSPFRRSTERHDPIAQTSAELSRLGMIVEAPPRYKKIGDERHLYTEEERAALADAQTKAMTRVAEFIRSPQYAKMADADDPSAPGRTSKAEVIRKILSRYKDPVRARVDRQLAERAKREARRRVTGLEV